jgi:hypothetical protein
MRLRRPVVAASALGLAGALLPTSGAAAEADRHAVFIEDITYQKTGGGVGHCTVEAHLDWVFGQEGTSDDFLRASTWIRQTPGHSESECTGGFPYDKDAGVTLHWTDHQFRQDHTYNYNSEGDVQVAVAGLATPYDESSHIGADGVSSDHTAHLAWDCAANCEWSHTLTFNPK